MPLELRCRDIGMDCDGVVRAETEEELMGKLAEHAKTVHGITAVSPELAAKAKAATRDL